MVSHKILALKAMSLVLYLRTGVAGGYNTFSWCTSGGMGLLSYVINFGACWGGGLAARPGLIDIWSGVYTHVGGSGDAYGIPSGMTTIRGGSGASYCGGSVVDDGIALGGTVRR